MTDFLTARPIIFKKYIDARSDLLLYISLTGGQSLKWINHEREGRVIYTNTTDRRWQDAISMLAATVKNCTFR